MPTICHLFYQPFRRAKDQSTSSVVREVAHGQACVTACTSMRANLETASLLHFSHLWCLMALSFASGIRALHKKVSRLFFPAISLFNWKSGTCSDIDRRPDACQGVIEVDCNVNALWYLHGKLARWRHWSNSCVSNVAWWRHCLLGCFLMAEASKQTVKQDWRQKYSHCLTLHVICDHKNCTWITSMKRKLQLKWGSGVGCYHITKIVALFPERKAFFSFVS